MKVEENGINGRPVDDDEYSNDGIPLSRKRSSKMKSYAESDTSDNEKPKINKKIKKEISSDDESLPLSRIKTPKNKIKRESNDTKPSKKSSEKSIIKKSVKKDEGGTSQGKNSKKNQDESQNVWRWWEEEKKDSSIKWTYLEHKGPVFAPPYERLPDSIKFYYDGQLLRLSDEAEEVAGFYAKMLDHDYTQKEVFNKNFFKDWRSVMTESEKKIIKELSKCNFKPMFEYFKTLSEERKLMTKEEKLKIKEANAAIQNEYGVCVLDGHKQKIGNFRVEPPGLFRGRGTHPKMGMLKKRIQPESVIINCSKDSPIPKAPAGHRWKEVRHDNSVTWLCCWVENIQGSFKYVMLNASSRLKAEKDWVKFETARKLHKVVDKIRADYREDFKHKEMRIRQRATALYFIDKLALRAGNEKDEDEADTVGCCSLRYEHIMLHEKKDDKEFIVEFDFLGKDSIRYQNSVQVPKRVFKNLQLFMQNKREGDDLFDRLNTSILNQYLRDLMDGLTAKVFRTYNASRTLEEQLESLTKPADPVHEKILSYNRANRAVAVLCNHQRAVPKTFAKSMENLQKKIDAKRDQIVELTNEAKDIKSDYKMSKTPAKKIQYEKLKKRITTMKEQLVKLQIQATDRDENKEIALGTSKLNYLDPRISVAWCRKYDVPLEKIFNKTQREKFQWAIDMATADYQFRDVSSDLKTNHLKEDEDDEEEPEDDEV